MVFRLKELPERHHFAMGMLQDGCEASSAPQPSSSSSSINLSGSKRFVSKGRHVIISRKTCYRLLQAKRTTSCFTWPISSEFYSDAPEVLLECVASSAARSNKEILRTLEHWVCTARERCQEALKTKFKAWVIPWQGVVCLRLR